MGDSALSPREIQTRIRAGESIDDVATDAGMEVARVEPFAVPVLAEREFVAGLAQSHPVRRGGETIAHRTLGEVVADRLEPRQIDFDTVGWDAWKLEGRRWTVKVTWTAGRKQRDARFIYDQAGRFSVADNDDARWLLGLHPPAVEPGPSVPPEEAEPTVGLNDDLALVRVVQPGAGFDDTAPIEGGEEDPYVEDAYAEAELEEVDGVYDIVTNPTGGIDVLYDMLSGFDEDSVRIYSGLMRPEAGQPPSPVLDEPPADEPGAEGPGGPTDKAAEPAGEPDQPSLLEGPAAAEPAPKAAKGRRKRAKVPSWDEIVFGSPSPRKPS